MADNDGFSTYYKYVTLENNKCIVWCFPELSGENESKEKARRRRVKDYVGLEHLDTPMLDSKTTRSGQAYCDVIMMTDHISKWEDIMLDHYANIGYTVERKALGTCGYQIAWSNEGSPVISVNFYPGKGKFMVQPGSRDPAHIDDWLRQFGIWKSKLSDVPNMDIQDIATATTATSGIGNNSASTSTDAQGNNSTSIGGQENSLTGIATRTVHGNECTAPTTNSVQENDFTATTTITSGGQVKEPTSTTAVEMPGNHSVSLPQRCIPTAPPLPEVGIHSNCGDFGNLADRIEQLTNTVSTLSNLVHTLVTQNGQLQKTVGDLTHNVSALTWKSLNQRSSVSQRRDLLIGSSVIREIDQNKLQDTDVICLNGGTTKTVKEHIDNIDCQYEHITLAVGENDYNTKPAVSPANVVASYHHLLDTAKAKAASVSVSSICPRLNSEPTRDTVESINAGLQVICSEKDGVTFVDNTPSFMLADGSLNDGYYLADGIHITRTATNKLAKNMNLHVKDQAQGVCKAIGRKHSVDKHTSVNQYSLDKDHVAPRVAHDMTDDWTVQRSRRKQRHNRPRHQVSQEEDGTVHTYRTNDSAHQTFRCYYCAEEGHDKSTCRHGKPVTCHTCHHTGHKAKFCGTSNK